MKKHIKPCHSKVPSNKGKHDPFGMREWISEPGEFVTNRCPCRAGDDDECFVYPIYNGVTGKPVRTPYFLRIFPSPKIYFLVGPVDMEKSSLALFDRVNLLAEGVAKGSTDLFGKLRLMTYRSSNVVYIVADSVPEPPVMSGLKPARLIPVPA